MSIFQPLRPTPYKNNGLYIDMQKQVPVVYDGHEVSGLLATITCDSLEQILSIQIMEVMRLTSFLRTHVPGFSGIQKTQVLEDKLILHSSAV